MAMVQPMMGQMQQMQVQVPAGMGPGMNMQVQTPSGLMNVVIPQGVPPGGAFMISVPAPQMVQPQMVQPQPVQMVQPQPVMMQQSQPMMMQPGMAQPAMMQQQMGGMAGGVPMKYGIDGNFSPLEGANHFRFKQGNVLWEAITGGCIPNSYTLSDRDRDYAVFIAKEESSCWCRGCCSPAQPAFVKFYNAMYQGDMPARMCCGAELAPAYKKYNPIEPAVLTMEKPGCPNNLAQCGNTNCWVCTETCQSQAWHHKGDVQTAYQPQEVCCSTIEHWEFPQGEPGSMAQRPQAYAHAIVPIGGGGLIPTVNVFASASGADQGAPFAVIEGPTLFGGCYDLCCDTTFTISKTPGKSANIGTIRKLKPQGGTGMLCAICSPADNYDLDFHPTAGLSPDQKAAIIAEMVHLDFLFFEAEQPLCRHDDQQQMCYILLCTCYCMGCLCPIECCMSTKQQ